MAVAVTTLPDCGLTCEMGLHFILLQRLPPAWRTTTPWHDARSAVGLLSLTLLSPPSAFHNRWLGSRQAPGLRRRQTRPCTPSHPNHHMHNSTENLDESGRIWPNSDRNRLLLDGLVWLVGPGLDRIRRMLQRFRPASTNVGQHRANFGLKPWIRAKIRSAERGPETFAHGDPEVMDAPRDRKLLTMARARGPTAK